MERCTHVGFPGNFRQPLTATRFRRKAVAHREIAVRWSVPVCRAQVLLGGRGSDVTARTSVLQPGDNGIEVQIDFAEGLPCLLLEAEEFSTGSGWETSLDGEHWDPAEVWANGNPLVFPDAEREKIVPIAATQQQADKNYLLHTGEVLLVDFHETEVGSLCFEGSGSGQIDIQVGESAAEASDPDRASFEQHSLSSVDLNVSPIIYSSPEQVLRFARFSATGEAALRNVRFEAKIWPAVQKGQFASSDEDLNRIWRAAVATLHSNMHDFYLDGIKRDGLVWHDGTMALEAFERVFFDADLSRQTLIAQTLPANPSPRDVGILDGPMYAVIGFDTEYRLRGEADFSRMFRDRIEDILRFYGRLQNAEGFVDAHNVDPYGFFPDWSATEASGPDSHGTPAYAQILLAAVFAAAGDLAEAWRDASTAGRYRNRATRLRTAIRRRFFDQQQGLFWNGLDRNRQLDQRFTSFAQAFAVHFGLASEAEQNALFRFLNDSSLRSSHFSLSQVVEMAAYAQVRRTPEAIARLKRVWLPLLDQGFNRFFEGIDAGKRADEQLNMYGRKYAASLCHTWAGAAPVLAISKGILGVEPLEPGFRVCAVHPQSCGLEWVRGTTPTPFGSVEVEWRKERSRLTLPAGVTAHLPSGKLLTGPGSFPCELG
jgi:hypothetical protein